MVVVKPFIITRWLAPSAREGRRDDLKKGFDLGDFSALLWVGADSALTDAKCGI